MRISATTNYIQYIQTSLRTISSFLSDLSKRQHLICLVQMATKVTLLSNRSDFHGTKKSKDDMSHLVINPVLWTSLNVLCPVARFRFNSGVFQLVKVRKHRLPSISLARLFQRLLVYRESRGVILLLQQTI